MSVAAQLPLELPVRPALGRADFFVSDANRAALARVEAAEWPGGRLALIGPEGAGKTHLAHVWAARSGARVVEAATLPNLDIAALAAVGAVAVEDADRLEALPNAPRRAAEGSLFHLHNMLATDGGRLLLTACSAPARWSLLTADLASRVSAIEVATLAPPDDALFLALIVKLFDDRQVDVPPNLAQYLLHRLERSFRAAEAAVEAIDRLAMAEKRRITRELAARALGWRAEEDETE